MKNYLAIDQGTTSSRSILFNSKLEKIHDSQKEYDLSYPDDGWVELNPDDVLISTKLHRYEQIKISFSKKLLLLAGKTSTICKI